MCGRSERATAHQADLVCLARRIVSTSAACSLRMVAIGVQSSSSMPSPGALRKRSRHSRRKRNSEGCGAPARSKVSSRYAVGYTAYDGEASRSVSRIASARTCRPSPEPPPLAAASARRVASSRRGAMLVAALAALPERAQLSCPRLHACRLSSLGSAVGSTPVEKDPAVASRWAASRLSLNEPPMEPPFFDDVCFSLLSTLIKHQRPAP